MSTERPDILFLSGGVRGIAQFDIVRDKQLSPRIKGLPEHIRHICADPSRVGVYFLSCGCALYEYNALTRAVTLIGDCADPSNALDPVRAMICTRDGQTLYVASFVSLVRVTLRPSITATNLCEASYPRVMCWDRITAEPA